jgi:simple sugar transport system permease protein
VIAATGGDAVLAYRTLVESSLGSLPGLAQTLNKATPILLGSLGVAFGLRAGYFNIGVDGQIYLGAIAATGVAFALASAQVPPALFVGLVLPAGLPAAPCSAGWRGSCGRTGRSTRYSSPSC